MLKSLFVSKTRAKLLKIFFDQPNQMYHVRELVRMTGEEINAVRRELLRMDKYGLVKKERRGNRLYHWFNKNCSFYYDLLSLVAKTVGLGEKIIEEKNKLGKIKFAMMSGRYLRGMEREKNRVDLLIVGKVVLPELARLVREEEARKEKEINYTVMTPEEFQFRKKRRDPFIVGILSGSRVMIIGDEEEMVSQNEAKDY